MSWADTVCAIAEKCNSFNSNSGSSKAASVPLVTGGHKVGIILPNILKRLSQFSDVFVVEENSQGQPTALCISDTVHSPKEITEAVDRVIQQLRGDAAFPCLKGWRNEMYAVGERFQQALFSCERAAARILGVRQYGVHMNGYLLTDDGKFKMWIGRRSATKPTFPGLLDNMVAGGISCGAGVQTTLVRECKEEASIPRHLAETAVPVGTISYVHEAADGIEPETEFVYDLQVPVDFIPVPLDKEVSEYYLWDMEKVKSEMSANHFKPNCALVILNFMMRHGIINPDSEPLYERLASLAHVDLFQQFSHL